MTCKVCKRTMRPRGTTAEEHPGTVQAAHRTACRGCVTKGMAERGPSRKKFTPGQSCKVCDRPMRPAHARAAECPKGWMRHAGLGVCQTCSKNPEGARFSPAPDRFEPFTPPGLESEDETVRDHARDLDLWLRDRRARGIPHEGTGAHTHTTKKKEKVA